MRSSDRAESGAGLFLPQPQGAQGRLVVEMEETGGRLARSVAVRGPVPRRHHEHVAGLPVERPIADLALALSLDHMDHLAAGAALAPGLLPGAQPPRLGTHGPERILAGARVHVTQ